VESLTPTPRDELDDVQTCEQTEMLALPPCLITDEEKRRHRTRLRRLYHAKEDKCVRVEWKARFPEDVATKVAFYAWRKEQRKADSAKRRADNARCGRHHGAYCWPADDHWLDQFSSAPLDSSMEDESDFEF
jgi:hypothetical protein